MKRSRLRRPTLDEVRAWDRRPRKPIARSVLPIRRRAPIAKIGRKAKRERAALDEFRDLLWARSGGRCQAPRGAIIDGVEVYVEHSHDYFPHDGTDPHHVWPEDRDRGIHDPDRGLWLCRPAHRWAHAHPEHARILGLLRPDRPEEP